MDYSIYVHIPFCEHRCHYCDFITTTGKSYLMDAYVDALINEFRVAIKTHTKIPTHSIYFGGGTPSLLPISCYEKLLITLHEIFLVRTGCEISIEANPGTLTFDYLKGLKSLGINRLSLGAQSFNSFDLTRLDRIHSPEDILSSYSDARRAGFDNINLDMIFALPWQTLESWENSLKQAINLSPDHFSIYSLILEPGTVLYEWSQKGRVALVDQDLEAEMFELAMETLAASNYEHYEISNWAQFSKNADNRCRHNLQYWLNQPYFGFGLGAHGYVEGFRTENTAELEDYLQRLKTNRISGEFPASPAAIDLTKVNLTTQMKDFMMLGLRLTQQGVEKRRFFDRYQRSFDSVFKKEIDELLNLKLVKWIGKDKTALQLTKRGVMVANQVFMYFI